MHERMASGAVPKNNMRILPSIIKMSDRGALQDHARGSEVGFEFFPSDITPIGNLVGRLDLSY